MARREKVVAVRLTDEQYEQLRQLAERRYLEPSVLVRLLVEKLLQGELKLNGNGVK